MHLKAAGALWGMPKHPPQDYRAAVKTLRASLVTLIQCVDDVCDLLEASALHTPMPLIVQPSPVHPPLRLERSTYTLIWRTKVCSLGNTFAFQILERLGDRPNQYIPTERLLNDVWLGSRCPSTVRSTVCRLRLKLRDAGMRDLADAIDGRASGHYRLVLPTE